MGIQKEGFGSELLGKKKFDSHEKKKNGSREISRTNRGRK